MNVSQLVRIFRPCYEAIDAWGTWGSTRDESFAQNKLKELAKEISSLPHSCPWRWVAVQPYKRVWEIIRNKLDKETDFGDRILSQNPGIKRTPYEVWKLFSNWIKNPNFGEEAFHSELLPTAYKIEAILPIKDCKWMLSDSLNQDPDARQIFYFKVYQVLSEKVEDSFFGERMLTKLSPNSKDFIVKKCGQANLTGNKVRIFFKEWMGKPNFGEEVFPHLPAVYLTDAMKSFEQEGVIIHRWFIGRKVFKLEKKPDNTGKCSVYNLDAQKREIGDVTFNAEDTLDLSGMLPDAKPTLHGTHVSFVGIRGLPMSCQEKGFKVSLVDDSAWIVYDEGFNITSEIPTDQTFFYTPWGKDHYTWSRLRQIPLSSCKIRSFAKNSDHSLQSVTVTPPWYLSLFDKTPVYENFAAITLINTNDGYMGHAAIIIEMIENGNPRVLIAHLRTDKNLLSAAVTIVRGVVHFDDIDETIEGRKRLKWFGKSKTCLVTKSNLDRMIESIQLDKAKGIDFNLLTKNCTGWVINKLKIAEINTDKLIRNKLEIGPRQYTDKSTRPLI